MKSLGDVEFRTKDKSYFFHTGQISNETTDCQILRAKTNRKFFRRASRIRKELGLK